MHRYTKTLVMLAIAIVAVAAMAGTAMAEETPESAKAKLRELRSEKTRLDIEYDNGIHQVTKEFETKIAQIKEDYRKAHNACVNEKNERLNTLRHTYDGKLKPLITEEKALIKIAGPGEESNFARTQADRMRGN